MSNPQGCLDLANIDTTPGRDNPFSPPQGWQGDQDEYHAFLKDRLRSPEYQQQMIVAVRQMLMGVEVEVSGPWRNIAQRLINTLVMRCVPI